MLWKFLSDLRVTRTPPPKLCSVDYKGEARRIPYQDLSANPPTKEQKVARGCDPDPERNPSAGIAEKERDSQSMTQQVSSPERQTKRQGMPATPKVSFTVTLLISEP